MVYRHNKVLQSRTLNEMISVVTVRKRFNDQRVLEKIQNECKNMIKCEHQQINVISIIQMNQ